MRLFDLHASKARYELMVVLLHLWHVNVKMIGGFISIPLADLINSGSPEVELGFCCSNIELGGLY